MTFSTPRTASAIEASIRSGKKVKSSSFTAAVIVMSVPDSASWKRLSKPLASVSVKTYDAVTKATPRTTANERRTVRSLCIHNPRSAALSMSVLQVAEMFED